VPHNVKEIDVDLLKFITNYQDTIPVIVCKNGKGHLKITKQAFKKALFELISELKISY
jgi:septin family protein